MNYFRHTQMLGVGLLLFCPFVVTAETPTTYAGLVGMVIDFINILIPAMFALIFVWLVWRIIDAWVIHADDPGKREEGKRLAITAVIVLALTLSTWGIVRLLSETFFG